MNGWEPRPDCDRFVLIAGAIIFALHIAVITIVAVISCGPL